jgi:hypothetical protein
MRMELGVTIGSGEATLVFVPVPPLILGERIGGAKEAIVIDNQPGIGTQYPIDVVEKLPRIAPMEGAAYRREIEGGGRKGEILTISADVFHSCVWSSMEKHLHRDVDSYDGKSDRREGNRGEARSAPDIDG